MKMFLAISLTWLALGAEASADANTNSGYFNSIDNLLISAQFAKLDGLAEQLRQTDARFPGGDPKLRGFYSVLGSIKSQSAAPNTDIDRSFQERQHLVQSWLDACPKSIAAHVSMAQLWINYAWYGRGHAYGAGTTDAQSNAYTGRLKTAQHFLDGLDPASDAEIYWELDQLAELSKSPAAAHASIYESAIRAFPTYFPYYAMRANSLEEKWYGEPGDLAHFVHSLLATPGGETGKIAYANIATVYLHEFAPYHRNEMLGVSWPELKDAFKTTEAKYGLGESEWDAYAIFAGLAGDNAAAQEGTAHLHEFAERGYILDQNNLAQDYLRGIGVERNAFEAIKLYERSAAQGDAVGEYQLGWIYENMQPDGWPKGYEQAMPWYRKAAAQGLPEADNNIGYLYENGYGVAKDYQKAAAMYELAADKDYARSEYHLGTLYDRGLGVPKDEGKALDLIGKAAIWNDEDAKKWVTQRESAQP